MQEKPGLKAVAVFEGAKGALVLAAGFGALALVHRDLQALAEELVTHSHLNPASRIPRIFVEAASRTTDRRLWTLAGLAAVYALVRLLEAYGLWNARRWAVWLGAASGGIYVPIEVYEIARRLTMVRLVLLLGNLAVVVYLLAQLHADRAAAAARAGPPRAAPRDAGASQDERSTPGKK